MTSQTGGTGLSRGALFPLWTEDEIEDENDCKKGQDKNDDESKKTKMAFLVFTGVYLYKSRALKCLLKPVFLGYRS